MHTLLMRAALVAVALTVSACGKPAPPDHVDLDAIFPQGPGRDLVLNNCQNCHTFVPIVVLQMDADAWKRNSVDHRPRIPSVSDADFAAIYAYLPQHFNPGRPVPELPKELLETWTSY